MSECLSVRAHNTTICAPGQIVGFGGGCGTSLVQESICCDTADQKDESQCGAAETDGRSDTYYVREKSGTQTGRHLAADQMPSDTGGKGCVLNVCL